MSRASLLWVSLGLAACQAPDASGLFNDVQVLVLQGESEAGAEFVAAIEQATETLHVTLPGGDNTDISDAIVAAHERGVSVEVISDFDLAGTPAIAALTDAGVPLFLADDGITYFDFTLNIDIGWASDETIMSNAWVVVDEAVITAANKVGVAGDDARILFRVEGEDIVDDMLLEHNQMFGGTDATAINAYSNPTKSILETNWRYPTQTTLDLEMWFGPQERLLKRVIDGTYGARSSIRILTDDFVSDGLAEALQAKAGDGFEVEVIVGPHFGEASSLLSRVLEDDTPDVAKRRVIDADAVPTVILIDWARDADGVQPESVAMVLTHDVLSAPRLYRGGPILTDQFVDATMWVLRSPPGPNHPLLDALEGVYLDHWDQAEAL